MMRVVMCWYIHIYTYVYVCIYRFSKDDIPGKQNISSVLTEWQQSEVEFCGRSCIASASTLSLRSGL